ncbi:MAG: hypothetical protein [Hatfieldvirus porci]|uniref:DNA-binding protein n=1 Tax=phage Lak_Megaphage_RVC_JS4_GC31 TaxID=3109228 RepID=A0ABZ0Z1L3_9CAUD|nr:MAG: hypothetical protein [phage Lak_Megaphage_RVC_AP3_GC31]WQJ52919.1 MAG: hypothetical protein [phage Lak_Megaphage_RVC_JS4_GC31]
MIKFKVKKSDKFYDLAYDFLSVMKKRIEAEIQQENEEKRKNSYANLVDRITLKEAKNLIGQNRTNTTYRHKNISPASIRSYIRKQKGEN